jgi:hypothetical protein
MSLRAAALVFRRRGNPFLNMKIFVKQEIAHLHCTKRSAVQVSG